MEFIKNWLWVFILLSCYSSELEKQIEEKPNIVWITSEDNSKHYMSLFDANGIETPNIASLAEHGLVFRRAFSNGAVCSVARSAIISGCYGPKTGSQFHRRMSLVPLPDSLMMFPAYLRAAGYYTTNNNKEDYNFIKGSNVWDESSKKADWRNRKDGQPFFHVFNIGTTHESRLHFTKEQMESTTLNTDINSFAVQPNHPDSDLFKYTNGYYRDKIRQMDGEVGEVLRELEEEGMMDNTFIFYFGDHGGVLPGSKGYIYETGLHVPMVVHIPKKFKHLVDQEVGSSVDGFVSFIDLAPTVLSLAGIAIPNEVDGLPFLGKGIKGAEMEARDETYSYADRFDEKYDHVRAVRKGRYKYMRSYQPYNFDGLMNNYRYKQLAFQEWKSLYEEDKLNEEQAFFFEKRAPEMLFDIDVDPYETNNLATNPDYQEVVLDLRSRLDRWMKDMPDLSFFPEHYIINNGVDNPVRFGKKNKGQIEKYIDVANLSLSEFADVKIQIQESLMSEDPWERYWALTNCNIFGKGAMEFSSLIAEIEASDTELINRVRASEYFGLLKTKDPSKAMIRSLSESRDPVEALLILNSIVLMHSAPYNFRFDFEEEHLAENVRSDVQVKRRLEYMEIL